MKSLERKVFPYLMLLPMIVIFGVFLFYPALNGLWISFTKWDGINAQEFVLFDNYIKLAGDGDFWRSFIRTMVFTVISVPGIYVAALGLALLLTRAIKGSNLFRAIFYWPTMISSIVVGLSWRFLLGEFGVINYIVSLFGGKKISWLTNPTAAMGVIIFVTVWSMAGYYMVMPVGRLSHICQPMHISETAAYIWKVMEEGEFTLDSLVEAALKEYTDVTEARLRKDICKFLELLDNNFMLDSGKAEPVMGVAKIQLGKKEKEHLQEMDKNG